jgi:hypothetical protein
MDERRLADRLSELDYEREWWAVYTSLGTPRSLGAGLRRG